MKDYEIKALRGLAEWHQDTYWRALAHKAADTIERQAKQLERMMTTYADDQEVLKGPTYYANLPTPLLIATLEQERDAALAEVERLKARLSESQDEAEAMRTTITSGEWGML